MDHPSLILVESISPQTLCCLFCNQTIGYVCDFFRLEHYIASSYILSPLAAYEHLINQYINYLRLKSLVDENQYFVNKFEKISNATYKSVMGDAPEMDDTEMRKIWKKYADQYIKFARDGHGTVGDNNVEVSYDDWIEKNNATLAIL